MSAIEAAAKAKSGLPERADILVALKAVKFQGVAYAAPEAFDAKGDDIAAVIFVNDGATSTASARSTRSAAGGS